MALAALGTVVVTGLYVLWLQTELGGARATVWFDDLSTTVTPLIGAAVCGRTAWAASDRGRAAWGLLGGACLSWALGNVVWTVYELFLDEPIPFPSGADLGYLALIPLALAGLLIFPGAPSRPRLTVQTTADGFIAGGSLLVVGWIALLGDVYRTTSGSVLQQVIALAYPVGDIVLGAVAVAVLLRVPAGRRLPLALVVGGLLCLVVADVSFAYFTAHESYATGNVYDTGWFAGFLVIGLGAVADRLTPPTAARHEARRSLAALRMLPVTAVSVAAVAAVAAYINDQRIDPIVFWTGVGVVALIIVRQYVTQSDNTSLMDSLRGHVRELEVRDIRLRALSAELERRLLELERSNADLAQFASVASHDLREPLQLMSGYLGSLRKHGQTIGDPKCADLAEGALAGIDRMRTLIDDILTYSLVAADQERSGEEVNLHALAAQTARELRDADPTAEIIIGELPTIDGRPSQLRQLFQNLLANAVKFVPSGRAPRVEVSARADAGGWRIEITDNGVGVPERERERVFEMFHRLRQIDAPGTGIGLAICRRIAEGHGGRVWLGSAPGGGTVVSVWMPETADLDDEASELLDADEAAG